MDALPEGRCWAAGPTRLHLTRALRAWATMDTRKQMQKDTLGLTNRGISEAGFNWEDFWQHQLIRIKEIAEGEQAPKEDASGTLKSTRMKHEISADSISDR